jgi:hypothetical protein
MAYLGVGLIRSTDNNKALNYMVIHRSKQLQ